MDAHSQREFNDHFGASRCHRDNGFIDWILTFKNLFVYLTTIPCLRLLIAFPETPINPCVTCRPCAHVLLAASTSKRANPPLPSPSISLPDASVAWLLENKPRWIFLLLLKRSMISNTISQYSNHIQETHDHDIDNPY